ncbi:MAG: PAS domain-containing sensor histidine kinase [Bacteroidota bacterium]
MHNEERFYALFNSSPEAILVISADGQILDANPAVSSIWGYEKEELIGRPVFTFASDAHQEQFFQKFHLLMHGSMDSLETFSLHKEGHSIPIEIRVTQLSQNGQQQFLLYINSLEDKKETEEALHISELRYKSLVDKMNEGLMITDEEEKTLFVNERLSQIIGISRESIIGKKSYEFLQVAHADYQELIKHKSSLRKEGVADEYEIELVKPDGERIWVLVGGAPNTDQFGHINGTIAIITDITDRKKAELQLKKTNNELDAFVYKASHDLKGPLASIIGVTNIARDEVADPKAHDYFQLIAQSATRLDRILMDLIDVTRINKGEIILEEVDLKELTQDIINSLEHQPEVENVQFNIQNRLSKTVITDQKLIASVLQNLITNGINYRDPQKPQSWIQISLSCTENSASVSVTDNGKGIPERRIQKVFDMFYRGDKTSKGSGLGLYIVKNALEKLCGTYQLESQEGQGTSFTFTLPLNPDLEE